MAHFDFVLLVLRVGLGVTMALHGWNKLRKGIGGTAGWFESIGMRPGKLNGYMAAFTEIGSGALFVVGLFTPLAAAAMIGLMLVAYWVAHRDNGFFIFNKDQGWEYVFVIGIAALALGGVGPGRWSFDNAVGLTNDSGLYSGWTGALITLLGGIGGGIAQLAIFYRPPAKA